MSRAIFSSVTNVSAREAPKDASREFRGPVARGTSAPTSDSVGTTRLVRASLEDVLREVAEHVLHFKQRLQADLVVDDSGDVGDVPRRVPVNSWRSVPSPARPKRRRLNLIKFPPYPP